MFLKRLCFLVCTQVLFKLEAQVFFIPSFLHSHDITSGFSVMLLKRLCFLVCTQTALSFSKKLLLKFSFLLEFALTENKSLPPLRLATSVLLSASQAAFISASIFLKFAFFERLELTFITAVSFTQ